MKNLSGQRKQKACTQPKSTCCIQVPLLPKSACFLSTQDMPCPWASTQHLQWLLQNPNGEALGWVCSQPEAKVWVRICDFLQGLFQSDKPPDQKVTVLQHQPLSSDHHVLQHLQGNLTRQKEQKEQSVRNIPLTMKANQLSGSVQEISSCQQTYPVF